MPKLAVHRPRVGHPRFERPPECGAVVEVLKVGELMHHDVVNLLGRKP